MKKLKLFYLKHKKQFVKSFICCVVIISTLLCLVVPASAVTYWHGDGIDINIISSFFWDHINGSTRISPVYDSTHGHVTFNAKLQEATTGNQLYIWCELASMQSNYGWLHCEVVGKKNVFSFDLSQCGIYEIIQNSRGDDTIDFGNPLIPFNSIGTSDLALYLTNDYPLPERFCIFFAYDHVINDETELSAFDLSFTQEYPYISTKDTNETIRTDQELVDQIGDDFKNTVSQNSVLNFGGMINDQSFLNVKNGVKAISVGVSQFINNVPYLRNMYNIALSIGFFAFLVGIVSLGLKKQVSHNYRKKGD